MTNPLQIQDLKEQLDCAKRAIASTDVEIAKHMQLRDTWKKIEGALEYQLHGRVMP